MFKIVKRKIDIKNLSKDMRQSTAGAYVSFEGWVRNHNIGKVVKSLSYDGEESIANSEGNKILREALIKYKISGVESQHRIGDLDVGDCAVWIGVTADHRCDAFEACSYIIEELKNRLPIWKKEHYSDSSFKWINSNSID